MNMLAHFLYTNNPVVLILFVLLIIAVIPAWPYSRGWGYYPTGMLIILIIAILLLAGCQNMTPQQKAATQTLVNIAQIAVDGVATHYGGAEAGVLASDAFSSVAAVAQGYVGTKIPADVLRASPGVAGVGTALDKIIEPNHVVSQAAVDQAHKIAAIATTLKPALVSP